MKNMPMSKAITDKTVHSITFSPKGDLRQSDLNRIVIHLFRRFFKDPENPGRVLSVKEGAEPMVSLVEFIKQLEIVLSEEAFEEIPEELRGHFLVMNRAGQTYRVT